MPRPDGLVQIIELADPTDQSSTTGREALRSQDWCSDRFGPVVAMALARKGVAYVSAAKWEAFGLHEAQQ